MLKYGNKEFRSLEEQVAKNQADIKFILEEEGVLNEFGLKIVAEETPVTSLPATGEEGQLIVLRTGSVGSYVYTPYVYVDDDWSSDIDDYKAIFEDWGYGDTIAVKINDDPVEHYMLTLTRANDGHPNDYWFNIGTFPRQGPQGLQGPQGPAGQDGQDGRDGQDGAAAGFGSVTATATGLPAGSNPVVSINTSGPSTAKNFAFGFSIPQGGKGDTGETGPQGPQGETGPQGPQGETGAQGPAGTEGLSMYSCAAQPSWSSTSIPHSQIYIPTGRTIKIGDFLLSADPQFALFRVTAIGEYNVTVGPLGVIKGSQGIAGNDGQGVYLATAQTSGSSTTTLNFTDILRPASRNFLGGDLIISSNVNSLGQLYRVTGVYPTTQTVEIFYMGDLKGPQGEQGPTGPQGPQGETGAQGEQGPQGADGKNVLVAKYPIRTTTIPDTTSTYGISLTDIEGDPEVNDYFVQIWYYYQQSVSGDPYAVYYGLAKISSITATTIQFKYSTVVKISADPVDYSLIEEEFEAVWEAVEGKQGTLTAGTNITIDENNVISATGGGTTYTAGTGIDISNNIISTSHEYFNTNGELSGTMTLAQLTALAADPKSYIIHTTGDVLVKVEDNSNFIMYSNARETSNNTIHFYTFKVMKNDYTWTLVYTDTKAINSFGNGLSFDSTSRGLGIDYDYIQRPLIAGNYLTIDEEGYIDCTAQLVEQYDIGNDASGTLTSTQRALVDNKPRDVIFKHGVTADYKLYHYAGETRTSEQAGDWASRRYSMTYIDDVNDKIKYEGIEIQYSGAWAYFTDEMSTGTVVTGTHDGTNWQTITIGDTTKAIPSGGGSGIDIRANSIDNISIASSFGDGFYKINSSQESTWISTKKYLNIIGNSTVLTLSDRSKIQDWLTSIGIFGRTNSSESYPFIANYSHNDYSYSYFLAPNKMYVNNNGELIIPGFKYNKRTTGSQTIDNYNYIVPINTTFKVPTLTVGNTILNETKVQQINLLSVDGSGNLQCNNIPAPPSTDGTYKLTCTVTSGVAAYTWESV